ncbi:hypothetical protein ABH892_004023 [Paenibacillus sp. RC254]
MGTAIVLLLTALVNLAAAWMNFQTAKKNNRRVK